MTRVTWLIHNAGKYLLISIYPLPTHPTHNFTHKNCGNLDTLPDWPKKFDHNRPARCAGQWRVILISRFGSVQCYAIYRALYALLRSVTSRTRYAISLQGAEVYVWRFTIYFMDKLTTKLARHSKSKSDIFYHWKILSFKRSNWYWNNCLANFLHHRY